MVCEGSPGSSTSKLAVGVYLTGRVEGGSTPTCVKREEANDADAEVEVDASAIPCDKPQPSERREGRAERAISVELA